MRIALFHSSVYEFDRPVTLGPHEIRLRPMPGALEGSRYSLEVIPASHKLYWYQDALGNSVARVIFAEATPRLALKIRLESELRPLDPFSFLVEDYAQRFPFSYEESLRNNLSPYLQKQSCEALTREVIDDIHTRSSPSQNTVDMLVNLNRRIYDSIGYRKRGEEGVQTPEQTLQLKSGSCRDSAWLFIHIVRHLNLAARFISGYQIQLNESHQQSAELHAWAEVYLPGAGWIGFDPTLGLLSAENYIPLAAASTVSGAAPVVGSHEPCEVKTHFDIQIEKR